MDEERRKKIEAGMSKWAELQKKKHKRLKSNASPNASEASLRIKSSPADPGGNQNICQNVSNVQNLENIFQNEPESDQYSSDVNDNPQKSVSPVLKSSFTATISDKLSPGASDNLQASEQSENAMKNLESSPGHTSNSDASNNNASSISESIHENESSENLSHPKEESFNSEYDCSLNLREEVCVNVETLTLDDSNENSLVFLKFDKLDNAEKETDEITEHAQKVPFKSFDEGSLTQVSVEASNLKEAPSLKLGNSNLSVLDDCSVVQGDSSSLKSESKEVEDEHISSLNDHELLSLCCQGDKLKEYQEDIQKKNKIISQLSCQLKSALDANQAAHLDGISQIGSLKDEINLLHLKMKETSEMLERKKSKNDTLELKSCFAQTEELSKSETGIQVHSSLLALLQSCDLSDLSDSDFQCAENTSNSEPLQATMHKLKDFLLGQFSEKCVQEFISLLQSDLGHSDPEPTQKVDVPTALKKLSSLNIVAKLIESLISLSAGEAKETPADFSPSKLQSFFLKRLHSVEEGDVLPDASENESLVSDYNYAEIDSLCNKPVLETALSVERLRKRNIAEDFTLVTEFLLDEMERISSFIPEAGGRGDGCETQQFRGSKDVSGAVELSHDSELKKLKLQQSKLESRLRSLKQLDKELREYHPVTHQASMDSDTMTISEDNIMMEELPLSCISLLSLTDSEYKGENAATDSESNFSRKVSLDLSRSVQDKEFCSKCERHVDLLREKYENEFVALKELLEGNYEAQRKEILESTKTLEKDKEKLEKENAMLLNEIKSLNEDRERRITAELEQRAESLENLKSTLACRSEENGELCRKLQEAEEKVQQLSQSLAQLVKAKTEVEISLQNQIADLIQEHEQDLESVNHEHKSKLDFEKQVIADQCQASMELLQKAHKNEIEDIRSQLLKQVEEREQNLKNEHSKTISMMEAAHCDESAVYQKKIESLLEEKCELLSKTTQEYESILKKNHRVLVMICQQLISKIKSEKDRVVNESIKSNGNFDVSMTEVLDLLNRSLEDGMMKFLNQNFFMDSTQVNFDETEYLPIEMRYDVPKFSPLVAEKKLSSENETKSNKVQPEPVSKDAEEVTFPSESSLDSDDLCTIHTEISKLQEEFQKDVAFYKSVNDELHNEIKMLRTKNQDLEKEKERFEMLLQEKDKELSSKESLLHEMNATAVKTGSQLSASDLKSWQLTNVSRNQFGFFLRHAAQTNSRLLHVLSDLVKTFLDIENDINAHLLEHGLIPSRSATATQHDDDTGQSVGSREDFNSLSLGDGPNLELTEDGPDLSPRAWDVFISTGSYENDLEGEDVVLGASRRLRLAVDHLLNLLSHALENQQNLDMKVLIKRNEELSHELQEESQDRDAVHMSLVTAESNVRRLESEKRHLEDLMRDLKEDLDAFKRELNIEKNKVLHLQREKESAYDEIQTLKEQCKILASRLGDPEKTKSGKMLNSTGTSMHENSELLQENSRLSSEKHAVQKNLSVERQSFQERLHQMELAVEELNAEKNQLMEKKCKEIKDLRAEMEAMEKQLQSNRKFINEQAQERELEREEFIKEINKMKEFVREKEKIQSNEAALSKEIESLEQLLRARIDDHKNVMSKKDEVEKELRQSVDKIRDLRDVIEELEKQLDLKTRTEKELKHKLASLSDSAHNQDKSVSNSDSESSKNFQLNGESIEQLHNLKEQLASQSHDIEMMSQSQTLLHELRGQIHFLEAKVEQRARVLESSLLSSASSPAQSGTTSPSGSQDSEPLQIPCEDGWEMSPRSIHWLEVRRLEEKIGRIVHIDEELMKKNRDLEQQLKKIKSSNSELQHENKVLQEKLSEQLVEISTMKSHMDEQKHRITTPQKANSFALKIEELQDMLEKQIENNKRIENELQETQTSLQILEEDAQKKDELIAAYQRSTEKIPKSNSVDNDKSLSSEFEFSSLEEIQNQLFEKIKEMELAKKDNEELKIHLEELKVQNASLKSLLTKTEGELAIEKDQVQTLTEEISCLTENLKRLEQDFNIVQDMMQKKERELATLHEETESQLKLEAEIEMLEKELTNQKNVEVELKLEIEKLQSVIGSYKNIEDNLREKDSLIQGLKNKHSAEIDKLKCQVDVLKNQLDVLRKIDVESPSGVNIEELVKQILDACMPLSSQDSVSTELRETLSTLLKKTMNSLLLKFKQNHEKQVNSLNSSWMSKIKEELTTKEKIHKSEKENLQKALEENHRMVLEKDAHWESKLKGIQDELNNAKLKLEEASKARAELESVFAYEVQNLKSNLESALKVKVGLETLIKGLKSEIEKMHKEDVGTNDSLAEDYNSQLAAAYKTFSESFEKEKQTIISSYQQKINHLEKELKLKLEQVQSMEAKHKAELSSVHKYFESRWTNEIKKVKESQSEELKKLKDFNERILAEKIQTTQQELTHQFQLDKAKLEQEHEQELERLRKKFAAEKQLLLEMKDKAVKNATQALETRLNANMAETNKQGPRTDNEEPSNWNEERIKLISSHRKEMALIRKAQKHQYEKLLQAKEVAHAAEIKRLEESYNQKIVAMNDLMKDSRRAAGSRSGFSDCGSNRTTTPSSDVTSSDEACSSCQEDLLSQNKLIVVDKIHQDTKRVQTLVENSAPPLSSIKEAHLWLDERNWIVNRIKTVISTASHENLKTPVTQLVEEVQRFRQNFETALEENADLKEKYNEMEEELRLQCSKLYEVTTQLRKQQEINMDLEFLLSSKASEACELRNRVAEFSRHAYSSPDVATFTPYSDEIGPVRSGDIPRSLENFSLYQLDLTETPSYEKRKNVHQAAAYEENIPPYEVPTSPVASPTFNRGFEEKLMPQEQLNKVHETLITILDKKNEPINIKLHGLYWVYRRSQSYNRALIYQKRYLLMLLKGFLITEKVTLTRLNLMCGADSGDASEATQLGSLSHFRSLVFVVIAIQRMKFYVQRWRLLAKIPTPQVIEMEVQSVFQNYAGLSPSLSPGDHLKSNSSSTSLLKDLSYSHTPTSLRTENKDSCSVQPDKSQLFDYVHRLEVLQKQLGLNDFS